MKKIIVDLSENGSLSLGDRDLITYLKDHKFRLIPRPVAIRITECLSPTFVWVGSSLTTKYVVTRQALRVYCNGDEKLYNDLLKL